MITGAFGLFYRFSASVQFIIQEEQEVAAKVAVCNPRLVSLQQRHKDGAE